ncbi:efflux RND transporter periplasmic adaptor subunit [Pseudodesulfovibrio senegalensis]|uniref:Biotin/lipoyl-binding protein n=1 Tax=Pseudodesulfovibrio senegalensis TaxID=1721087 RepID=A0A6N6N2H1_9BACT|nr:biotin/lipoyl-binding protein [Pseudodesulfovibrio senegalensis]KAB1440391.1 biotin/lipoyl-binding protein [Pseudodesulfovibrio senegalensis]
MLQRMIARIVDFCASHRRLVLFPAVAFGVLVLVVMVKLRGGPQQQTPTERVVAVRVLAAPELAVVPRVVGYGYVQPGQVWDAVAEVGGKVVFVHRNLKKGNVIGAGEEIIGIDPAEPGLARERTEADVQDILAQIQRLDQAENNARRQLRIEKGKLALSQKEFERNKKLHAEKVISKSELDRAEQNYLTQSNAVQNFQSTLNTIPAERQQLMARLASARSQLADARLDEAKTVIQAPFDCRVAAESVEPGQAVKIGDVLATLDSIGVSEAFAQMPLYSFKNILPRGFRPSFSGGVPDMQQVRDLLGLTAVIRLRLPDGTVEWDGRVARISESVDPDTRTIGIYVAVDDPYLKVEGGVRPPLLKNMYAEVELRGRPRKPAVVVPRSAVHEGVVYVADKEDRLAFRPVKTYAPQSGFVTVSEGLDAGERVVLSDVIPAIKGMKLKPVADEEALQRLVDEALGRGAVQ